MRLPEAEYIRGLLRESPMRRSALAMRVRYGMPPEQLALKYRMAETARRKQKGRPYDDLGAVELERQLLVGANRIVSHALYFLVRRGHVRKDGDGLFRLTEGPK